MQARRVKGPPRAQRRGSARWFRELADCGSSSRLTRNLPAISVAWLASRLDAEALEDDRPWRFGRWQSVRGRAALQPSASRGRRRARAWQQPRRRQGNILIEESLTRAFMPELPQGIANPNCSSLNACLQARFRPRCPASCVAARPRAVQNARGARARILLLRVKLPSNSLQL